VFSNFPGARKIVKMDMDLEKEVEDIKLRRCACYLMAINGDPRKEKVAFTQAYFVTQTRKIEVLEQMIAELERVSAREKLSITEKEFSAIAFSCGVDGRGLERCRVLETELYLEERQTKKRKRSWGLITKKFWRMSYQK